MCSAIGYAGPTAPAASATVIDAGKIMPLGDSITYGGGMNAGYRGPLYDLLTSAGISAQFVGDSTLNAGSLPANQSEHAGHSSYTTYDIANNLDGIDDTRYEALGGADRDPHGGYWLTGGHGTGRDAVTPNIILLMVGINDMGNGQDANAEANLQALLGKLTTLEPDAQVLIADIMPSTSYGTARVDHWNAAVDDAVSYFQNLNKHVTRVDLNTNFPSDGLSGDGVHPNDIGYAWMAGQWTNSIMALSVPEPNVIAILATGLLGAVPYVCRKTKRKLSVVGSPIKA
jgi:hypothetical protein